MYSVLFEESGNSLVLLPWLLLTIVLWDSNRSSDINKLEVKGSPSFVYEFVQLFRNAKLFVCEISLVNISYST